MANTDLFEDVDWAVYKEDKELLQTALLRLSSSDLKSAVLNAQPPKGCVV